jgi:hypothetical protein
MTNKIETFHWRIPEDYEPDMAAADLEWFLGEYNDDGSTYDIDYDILDDHTITIVDTRQFVEALVKECGGSIVHVE